MLYCPNCGNNVLEEEQYCVSCGQRLPEDINQRDTVKKRYHKLWYIPLVTAITLFVTSSLFYLYLEHQSQQAKENYELGEKSMEYQNYEEAKNYLLQAINQKENFTQAQMALAFIQQIEEITQAKAEAETLIEEKNYIEAIALINSAENNLNNYHGTVVNDIVDELIALQNYIKTEQLNYMLTQNPNINTLKSLLWEAESINNEEAKEITEVIRNQIIEFTYSKASEQLSNKQFNDAQAIVEDGLKYAPESDKLLSLQSTIENEKVSFEITQQQRIEQALNTAEEERELNETDAIELLHVEIDSDDQDNLVIKGEVKSVATVPIHSILIDYSLMLEEEFEILSNEIYVYPDTLYPGEIGQFEFTHYDTPDDIKSIEVEVNKITWYTSY